MKESVDDCYNNCVRCTYNQRYTAKYQLGVNHFPRKPGESIYIDCLLGLSTSSRGDKAVLVIYDFFSRYGMALPLRSEKAKSICEVFVEKYLMIFGPPRRIFSDNHPNLIGSMLSHVCKIFGIRRWHVPQYGARANCSERLVGQIAGLLRCSAKSPDAKNWHLLLPLVCYSLNATSSPELGGFSPNEIQFGRDMPNNFVPLIPPAENFEAGRPGEYLQIGRAHV